VACRGDIPEPRLLVHTSSHSLSRDGTCIEYIAGTNEMRGSASVEMQPLILPLLSADQRARVTAVI
jgi:hypothetical protein